MYNKLIDYVENNITDYTDKIKNHMLNNNIYDITETLKVYHNKDSYRELTFNRLKSLINSNLFQGINFSSDYEKYFAIFDHTHFIDGSLSIKLGVNFGLFGFTLVRLGTEKHMKYVNSLIEGKIFGCFAMTELSHGSDVKNIKTTAIYNSNDNTFTINTNDISDRKFWIGNAYLHATYSIVFAQLYIDEKCEGVHAFLVPLRNFQGNLLNGIKISDCGTKLGLNGVDNGMIEFNNVIIPYDNLLDKYCSITGGKYISDIVGLDKRFSNMLAALTLGRIGLSSGALQYCKKALFVAINYALQRKQFEGNKIINYHSIQDRLLINLSKFFIFTGVANHLKNSLKDKDTEYIHKISSGFKPIITWFTFDCLQKCRESCGGFGFDLMNEFGILRNDTDIYTTFEGDNHVLLQQLGKILLTHYGKKYKEKKELYKTILLLTINWPFQDINQSSNFMKILKRRFLKKTLNILNSLKSEYDHEKNLNKIWNNHQRDIIDMSKYYIDYLTYKISYVEIQKISNDNDKNILINMYNLLINKWIIDNKYYLKSNKLLNDIKFSETVKKYNYNLNCIINHLDYILQTFRIPSNLFSSYLINFNLSKL